MLPHTPEKHSNFLTHSQLSNFSTTFKLVTRFSQISYFSDLIQDYTVKFQTFRLVIRLYSGYRETQREACDRTRKDLCSCFSISKKCNGLFNFPFRKRLYLNVCHQSHMKAIKPGQTDLIITKHIDKTDSNFISFSLENPESVGTIYKPDIL